MVNATGYCLKRRTLHTLVLGSVNVATIRVGRQGQLKHIYPFKYSSLYPKTNFHTALRSFYFLFYLITFILQIIIVS